MNFTLDVKKWRCGGEDYKKGYGLGNGKVATMLLCENGKMCCLGQFGKQIGVDNDILKNSAFPHDAGQYSAFVPMFSKKRSNTRLSLDLMNINDNKDLTINEKIAKIKTRLNRNGHTLTVLNAPKA